MASAPPSSASGPPPVMIVPPDYNVGMVYSGVLNPCQPGTPCGDAAPPECKAGNIVPPGPHGSSAPRCGERTSDPAIHLDPNATRYQPSAEVSARVKTLFIQLLSQKLSQTAGPAEAQRVRDVLAERDLVSIWTRAVAPEGLHPNDMADAVASYWILNWVIANRAVEPPGAAVAVRNQLWPVMARGQLAALPESGRQSVAEVRVIQFVLQAATYQNARKSGDAARLARLSDDAEHDFLAENKIDLRRLTLTNKGFAKRN
jgi:hypothetical protein